MSSEGKKTVLAIDPGSAKSGMAVVTRLPDHSIELGWHKVVPTDDVVKETENAMRESPFEMVVVGAGTTSSNVVHRLREAFPAIGILLVNEQNTTIQARERYWEDNPRKGWRRILPATLQTPPEPYDDCAALVIAERMLL